MVFIGMGLRLGQYLSDQSYWHDEAFLVLNIFQKDAGQLMGPLDARPAAPQSAAPLFLLAQRGVYVALGGSEYAMRAVPMLAGALGLGLFALLAWRVLSPMSAAFAVALFALSDRLIWHASEAKQYSSDAFAAVVLLYLALAGHSFVLTSVVAAAAIWGSHAAIFIYAGISLAMAPGMLRRERSQTARWLAGNLLVGASLAALYLLSIRAQVAPHFFNYWADRFVPWAHPWLIPWWLIDTTYDLFDYPFANASAVVMALAGLGVAWWWGKNQRLPLAIILWPVAWVLLAAALHCYPYGARRLNLFLAPGLFLLAGAGVQRIERQRIKALLIVPLLLIVVEAAVGGYHLFVPRMRGHIRPAVAFVKVHRQPGDGVIALNWEEFRCYWPEPNNDVRSDLAPTSIPSDWRRFWVLWSYPSRQKKPDKETAEQLRIAHKLGIESPAGSYLGPGGAAMLFERRPADQLE